MMGWIRLSDDFYDNGKLAIAGAHGMALYLAGLGFCNRNLTDGLIPRIKTRALVDFTGCAVLVGNFGGDDNCDERAVIRLLEADLWHEDGHDCDRCPDPGPHHYVVHDYLDYQPSRAEIEAKRDEARERMKTVREARSRFVRANKSRSSVEVRSTPTPNPNPIKEGGAREENSPSDDTGLPPRSCPSHPDGTPDPCGPCADYRKRHDAAKSNLIQARTDERLAAMTAIRNCPVCDDNGLCLDDQDRAVRCSHA